MRDVVQRDATLPDDCRETFAETCRSEGIELCVAFVWKKFTLHAYDKRWRVHEVGARWTKWVLDEIAWTKQRALKGAKSPGLVPVRTARASRPIFEQRVQWQLEAQAQRPEVLAAAARAMAVFA